jgi:hypothetical protein
MPNNSRKRGMSFLVHGHSKVGKSSLALTGPAPRLVCDIESAAHLLPNKLIWWNPLTEAIPVWDGSWDTCVVDVDDFETVLQVYNIIKTGNHPFRTMVIDSVSELQSTIMKMTMRQQDWGLVLAKLSSLCRDLRDLPRKRNNPLEILVLTAMTKKYDASADGSGGIYKPYLQGQIATLIPYWYDVVAYYFIQPYRDPKTGAVINVRRLLTAKNPEFEAGNRVAGMEEYINYPNLEQIADQFFGPREVPQEQNVPPVNESLQNREEALVLNTSQTSNNLPKMNLPTIKQ